jgi:uncharacterized protein YciW
MARLNREDELASHYQGMVDAGDTSLADPSFDGGENTRLQAILRHTDLVTRRPKDAVTGDIAALKLAGISEPDIVRLSEIIAFVNYQARVVAGLRLMAAVS